MERRRKGGEEGAWRHLRRGGKGGGEQGGVWKNLTGGGEVGVPDYGVMVRPSQLDIALYEKGGRVGRGLGMRGLRKVAAF